MNTWYYEEAYTAGHREVALLNSRHREVVKTTVAIQESGKVTLKVIDGLPRILCMLAMTRQMEITINRNPSVQFNINKEIPFFPRN